MYIYAPRSQLSPFFGGRLTFNLMGQILGSRYIYRLGPAHSSTVIVESLKSRQTGGVV